MLVFRILPAALHPLFFSIALVTAAKLVPPEKSGQAVTKVFMGITVGFALGIPLTSYLADQFSLKWLSYSEHSLTLLHSLEYYSYFLLCLLKKNVFRQTNSYTRQTVIMVKYFNRHIPFAAMFSVYSYFAEYLAKVTSMNGSLISIMLFIFGIVMILGNHLFGGLLQKA